MRILVVGGVAAGASAAVKARRVNQNAEIIVFEKTEYVSFANCGLPYHIGNVIEDRDDLLLVTPELFRDRFNIDVRIGHEAVDIDPAAKTLTVKSEAGQSCEPYDKLIIATGGAPIRPKIKGIDLPNVFNVFTVPDTDSVIAKISKGAKSAVVIGGGFIGLETAENLLERGLKTTLIEKLPYLMSNFDEEFSAVLADHLISKGLDLRLGVSLEEIAGDTLAQRVVLEDGSEIECDLVILAMGARPNNQLAEKAGLSIGKSGGIIVDATMQTNVRDIYAAGDIVESVHLVSGKKVRIPLAGSANKQGRVAGACAAGSKLLFKGVLGSAIIKVCDLTAARTGLNEREAQDAGFAFDVTYYPGNSNAAYYPGAGAMIIKLITQSVTGKLLGAQIVGRRGVDKRIDVLATAIYAGLTAFDLEQFDLAYAPPFSSAKDPVIMTGMIAANMLRGDVLSITPGQIVKALEDPDTVLLDVRTSEEYAMGALDGAILLPVDELRSRYRELDPNKQYLVYCRVGYRAYNACLFLNSKGFKTQNISGGYLACKMIV